MRNLSKGTEPNLLKLLVGRAEIRPFSMMKGGMIEDGIIIRISQYNLEDILLQMLEDYGEEELIKRIKELD
jgi:hypothetical protein